MTKIYFEYIVIPSSFNIMTTTVEEICDFYLKITDINVWLNEQPFGHWYFNNGTLYFEREEDRNWFALRWS